MLAVAAVGGMALLARRLRFDEPTAVDREVRWYARRRLPAGIARALGPLFPLGLPGGYITIAYFTARALRRRGYSGGPAVITSAVAGWLAHRGAKLVYSRVRPRDRGRRERTDSYPSGHTTGVTALAVTTAYVLRRQRVASAAQTAAIAIGVPALMGAYRVIADDHWTTDVFGGWLLGGAVGLACNAVLADSLLPPERRPGRRVRSCPTGAAPSGQSVPSCPSPFSSDRHRYHAATELCGLHLAPIFFSFFGVGRVRMR